MARMVMGVTRRWLETQSEEGGVMRASDDVNLDKGSPQDPPPVGEGLRKSREPDARFMREEGGQGDIALALSLG